MNEVGRHGVHLEMGAMVGIEYARHLGMKAVGFLMMSHMHLQGLAEQAKLMESYGAKRSATSSTLVARWA